MLRIPAILCTFVIRLIRLITHEHERFYCSDNSADKSARYLLIETGFLLLIFLNDRRAAHSATDT